MEKKSTKGRAKTTKKATPSRTTLADLTPPTKQARGIKGGYIIKTIDKMTPK